jgi:hypothetical protein
MTPRKKKPSKSLEKAARSVKDADDFVQHIANIADRYRREHALDSGPRARELRQALRTFHKQSTALAQWLEQAQKAGSHAEQDALNKIGVALYGSPVLAHAEGRNVAAWLAQAGKAADKCSADTKSSGKRDRNAPRVAAEGLRATFEHHQLKWSTSAAKNNPGAAVLLLRAIANTSGDAEFTVEDAREALLQSARREPAPVRKESMR